MQTRTAGRGNRSNNGCGFSGNDWQSKNDFKNGRHFSAFIGLVPKHHSSGGKDRLLGISKRGDSYLRTLLIHGARAVLMRADKKSDYKSRWVIELKERQGTNRACVALANKNARTVLALLQKNENYKKIA